MTQHSRFEFVAATFTPFAADGSVDPTAIPPYVDFLAREQLRRVFLNGTTGESLSLTTDERLQIADTWFQHGQGRLAIMVHVGHNCIHEAERLAQHAAQRGATAIASMAPTFFLPRNMEELLDFLEPIAAAAPLTDFYFYHLPSLTGLHLELEELISKAALRIPTFAGVKYTHDDLGEFQRCEARWGSKYQLFFGRDELLLPALCVNARGGVGSIYGLTPQVFSALAASFFAADQARALRLSNEINHFIDVLKRVGILAGGKALLAELGIGSGAVRLPLKALSQEDRSEVLHTACTLPHDGEKWKLSLVRGNRHGPLGDDTTPHPSAAP